MFGLGLTEIIIVLFIILLIFGARKLPDIASGLGKGVRDFKNAMRESRESASGASAEDTEETEEEKE